MTRVIYFLLFWLYSAYTFGQAVECTADMDNKSITLNAAICNNNGTVPTLDDYISFVVAGTNLSNVYLENLPLNTTVSPLENIDLIQSNGSMYAILNGDGPYQFTSPSAACIPLNLTVNWSTTECQDSRLLVLPSSIIPTLGQWGIIILVILIFIVGYLEIEKGKTRPIYLRSGIIK